MSRSSFVRTRVAVSPSVKDMKLGAYRTCAYSYLIALNKGLHGGIGKCVLRCDDSDPVKHHKEYFPSLYSTLTEEIGIRFDAVSLR